MEPYVLIEKHYVPIQMYREMMGLPSVINNNNTQLNHSFDNLMNYSPIDFSYYLRDSQRPLQSNYMSRPNIINQSTSNVFPVINTTSVTPVISTSNTTNNITTTTSNINSNLTNTILDTLMNLLNNTYNTVLPNTNGREANIQGVIISNVPLNNNNTNLRTNVRTQIVRTQRILNDDDDHGFNPNIINQYTDIYKYSDFKELDIFYNNNSGHTVCSICQDNFENDKIIRQLKNCKHVFHLNCVDTWFTNRSTCPTCRQPLIQRGNSNHTEENEENEENEETEENEDDLEEDPDYDPENEDGDDESIYNDDEDDDDDEENEEIDNVPEITINRSSNINLVNEFESLLLNTANSSVIRGQVSNLIRNLFPNNTNIF